MADGPYKVTDVSQTPNAVRVEHSSETVGDKLHCREGNNPDQQLRCLNNAQWKGCGITQTVRMLA